MKQIAKQLIFHMAVLYTAVTAAFSFFMYMDGAAVEPRQYLRLLGMFAVLWGITFLRALLDRFQWGLRQHYLLKRLLFAPLYLGVTLWTLLHFGAPFENSLEDALFIEIVFSVCFVVSLILLYPSARKQEQQLDRLLKAYQSQLEDPQ